MRRKKWAELEEQTLHTKYSDLHKIFKPIADHVNTVHHLQDPLHFPFKWSWRDVSIKQKIRTSSNDFNWNDGENHWENFLKYKEVFGDVELDVNENAPSNDVIEVFGDDGVLGLGSVVSNDEEEDDEDGSGEGEEIEESVWVSGSKMRKGVCGRRIRMVSGQVLELMDVLVRREEKRREREWSREKGMLEREGRRIEMELCRERREDERNAEIEMKGLMLEERQMMLAKRDCEKRLRLEREFDEEKRRKKWNGGSEHEHQMMQMHADACQTQTNLLGVMARLVWGGLGILSAQALQNLLHPGGLSDSGKPDAASPSEFL
ncbi:unnamed protein product [Withania somnifera]